jgi:hypothetical protein
MYSRATPAQIEAVNHWLGRRFPGCTVESADTADRSSRIFRVDGPNHLPVHNLEIHMFTFRAETAAEIVEDLDAGGYYQRLVQAGRGAVRMYHPAFGDSNA